MGRLSALAGEKVHERTVRTTNYAVDGTHLLCVGRFTDMRLVPTVNALGKSAGPGPLHDLELRVLVRTPELVIEDVEVDIVDVPFDDCRTLARSLDGVKGLSLSRGFTAEVKRRAGGAGGCTHLVHLLTTMAPAILQGYWAALDAAGGRSGSEYAASSAAFLKDSCYAWREDGDAYARLSALARPED